MKKIIWSILFTLTFACQVKASTTIHMASDFGDWVGGGLSYDFSDQTGSFTVSISDNNIIINYNNASDNFGYRFAAPNNRNFARGAFLDAQRTPFRGPLNPGLEVTGNSRGCNTIQGEFYIFEIVADDNDPVLALDFVQYCDNITTALRGSIRINSVMPIPYNLPLAVPIVPSIAEEGREVMGDGSNSLDGGSAIQSYFWKHVSGPVVTFDDESSANPAISIPGDISLGGEDTVISLTITNVNDDSDTGNATISVNSKSDPHTYFRMSGMSGEYVSAGNSWSYDDSIATILTSRNQDNGVNVSINGAEWWSANFAAAGDVELTEGIHDPATRFPFQASNEAGLSVFGNGRGCNTNFGSFEVLKLVWENDIPISFHATFDQYCESLSAPLLSGEVGFNVAHPSVPTAEAGMDLNIDEGEVSSLNGSASSDLNGAIKSFFWTTDSPDFVLFDADTSRPNFTAPLLGDRVQSKIFTATLLIIDYEGYKSKDEVKVTILMNNSAPLVTDDAPSAHVGGTITIEPLVNDTDADGQILIDSIQIIDGPSYGSAFSNSFGEIIYTHTGSHAVVDSLTYTITDNDGAVSEVATVNITITVNSAPVAQDDSSSVQVGQSVNIIVLANDTDSDGQVQTNSVSILAQPSAGTISVNSAGVVTYTHTGGNAGNDSFTYTVNDNVNATSNVAMVRISITAAPVNVAPASKSGGGSIGLGLLMLLGLIIRRYSL